MKEESGPGTGRETDMNQKAQQLYINSLSRPKLPSPGQSLLLPTSTGGDCSLRLSQRSSSVGSRSMTDSLPWQRGGRYYQISSCGRFTVSAAIANSEQKFTAWHVNSPRSRSNQPKLEILGTRRDPAEARAPLRGSTQRASISISISTGHLKWVLKNITSESRNG